MISNLFFYGKLKNDSANPIIYEEDFVSFYLNYSLRGVAEFGKTQAENVLEDFYGKDSIKNNKVLPLCEQLYICNGKNFLVNISEGEQELYEKVEKFDSVLKDLFTIKNDMYEEIDKDINNESVCFDEKIKKSIVFYNKQNELSRDGRMIILYEYYYMIKNYFKFFRIIDSKLEKIPDFFNSVEITKIVLSNEQLNFFIHNNVFTLKNLKYMSIDDIIVITCIEIEEFIDRLSWYAIKKEDVLKTINERIDNNIKPEWDLVIQKRYDCKTNEKRTLADIGKELNLSRERVRQIENKAIEKLVDNYEYMNRFIYCLYKTKNNNDKNYITIEDFCYYINDERLLKYLLISFDYYDFDIKFNEEYGLLYNNNELPIEETIREIEKRMPNIILKQETEEYDTVEKKILDNKYRIYQNRVFIKKGVNIRDIYIEEIKENFIEGYDIGKEDDYNKLVKIIINKYGDIEVPSMRAVQGMIDRSNFVIIDRGKYIAKEYASSLPEALADEIIKFIIKNKPIVSYSLIYEEFKQELVKFNIDNRFYLKGCIDEKIPEDFKAGRDFITVNSEEIYSSYDIMHEIFKSFDGSFTVNDVKEKMPGLKGYNYENYARIEEENGLIQISPKTYIYINKLGITDDTKYELKQYIDELFVKLDSSILTSKKVYSSLKFMKPDLFNKLNISARFGDFELFSIIQFLFKNNYYYSRPIISLEEDFRATSYLLIQDYAKKQKSFKYKDIKKYILKMNLGHLGSYLNFMDDLSDDYVQVARDEMLRKEEFKITDEQLKKMEEFLKLLLKNKEISTEEFDGYYMLPRIDRSWNKYLLIGIIKTYFKDDFEIVNTTNFYDTTDYIIRRTN